MKSIRRLCSILPLSLLLGFASAAAAQNAGAQAFRQCSVCHSIDKSGRNGVGPSLYHVMGRKSGSVAGFNYSPALKNAGISWDEKSLDAYLAAPQKKVPGSRMPTSVADPAKRAAIIAYLKTEAAK